MTDHELAQLYVTDPDLSKRVESAVKVAEKELAQAVLDMLHDAPTHVVFSDEDCEEMKTLIGTLPEQAGPLVRDLANLCARLEQAQLQHDYDINELTTYLENLQ